jgi:hypothetical protein
MTETPDTVVAVLTMHAEAEVIKADGTPRTDDEEQA